MSLAQDHRETRRSARLVALAFAIAVSATVGPAHAVVCDDDVIRREVRTLVLQEVTTGGTEAPDEAAKWAARAVLEDSDADLTIVGEDGALFAGEDLALQGPQ
jgi:hypothetical protein